MGSGASKEFQGAVIGTGALLTVATCPWRPRRVRIMNVDGGPDEGEWVEEMAEGSVLKRVAAGTLTLATTGGITPTATGFTLGTDADLNVDGELIRFICTE